MNTVVMMAFISICNEQIGRIHVPVYTNVHYSRVMSVPCARRYLHIEEIIAY